MVPSESGYGLLPRQVCGVRTPPPFMEKKLIPPDIDYNDVSSLRLEARQKLIDYKPVSVGQASRISGVSPADISVLLVYLEQRKN